MIDLDKHNPMPNFSNRMNYGFFILTVEYCGAVSIDKNPSIHFTGNSQAHPPTVFPDFNSAINHVKKSSLYVWENNNRADLIRDYNLSYRFVTEFLGCCWPDEVPRPRPYQTTRQMFKELEGGKS